MKKALLIGVVVLLLFPLLPSLMPTPFSPERLKAAFEKNGLEVTDFQKMDSAMMEAVEEYTMKVNGARVELYLFDDRGKIAKQVEYNRPTAGDAMVEAWNISESLGAAKPTATQTGAERNGMYMLVVTSEDKALRQRIFTVFKGV